MADLASNAIFDFQNVIIVTLDSCRYDTFEAAAMPNLKGLGTFRKGYTQATYTLPAHISILTGFLPSTNDMSPLYDRLARYLFFIRGGRRQVESFMEFPSGTVTISSGFKKLGYRTACISATEWFRHPFLYGEFECHHNTGINIREQVYIAKTLLLVEQVNPIFMLLNIGETHDPYRFGSRIDTRERLATKLRTDPGLISCGSLFNAQVDCCRYIDECIFPVFAEAAKSTRDTIIVVCSDHGECFGEDGLFGHGFFHPKVMEVPLGIFLLAGKGRS